MPARMVFRGRPIILRAKFPRAQSTGLTFVACALLATSSLVFVGCDKASSENIQLWKTTEKGPGKLANVLGDRGTESRLRAEAAGALVEIGKADEVEATLAAMPAGERWDVFKALLPLYMNGMKEPEPTKALVYRDALFSVRALAQPEDQARIDAALLPGIEQGLRTGRFRNGRHSTEKILGAIGPAAGTMLANLLAEPILGYPAVADLLARVGDDAARAKGASNLVARARQQKPVPEAMWRSLGALGGPEAVKFLQDRVEHGAHDDALSAVRALRQRREPAPLAFALKVAGDPKADRAVRDEMFAVVETIGGPEAKEGLVRVIQAEKEELVRYRAFESLLTVAKQDGVQAGLEAFPASATYKKVDVDDLLVKLIEKLGAAARPVLVKSIESKYPLARMTAVMALEHVGKAPDAAALAKVEKDTATIKGFPAGDTIGKEATRVAAIVRSKT